MIREVRDRPSEYPYSGAWCPVGATLGTMLWSDDQPDKRHEELRRAQAMVRRAMVIVALAAALVMALTAWRV